MSVWRTKSSVTVRWGQVRQNASCLCNEQIAMEAYLAKSTRRHGRCWRVAFQHSDTRLTCKLWSRCELPCKQHFGNGKFQLIGVVSVHGQTRKQFLHQEQNTARKHVADEWKPTRKPKKQGGARTIFNTSNGKTRVKWFINWSRIWRRHCTG